MTNPITPETREYALDFYHEEEMGQLKAAILEACRNGDTHRKIAERSWVGKTTIDRLMDGTTKRPIGFTVSQLWKALGKEFIPPVSAIMAMDAKVVLQLMGSMTEIQRTKLISYAREVLMKPEKR